MHYTTKQDPIYLIDRTEGIIRAFTNFDHLVLNWSWLRWCDIAINHKDHIEPVCGTEQFVFYHDYVLRYSTGKAVDPKAVAGVYWKRFPRISRYRKHPGRKRHLGRYHRRMRTFQERKWADAWDDEEFAPKTRAKRNSKNLPTNWDDFARSHYYDRNWKHFRKHQWRDK